MNGSQGQGCVWHRITRVGYVCFVLVCNLISLVLIEILLLAANCYICIYEYTCLPSYLLGKVGDKVIPLYVGDNIMLLKC